MNPRLTPNFYGKRLLMAACFVVGMSNSTAQNVVTLRPVDTGRSVVSFTLGDPVSAYDRFAVKTNLLYTVGTMTPNLGFDFGLGQRTTIGLAAGYNKCGNLWDYSVAGPGYDPDNFYKRRLDHIFGKVEFRYWLDRRFKGHFAGINAFYADYRAGELSLSPVFDKRYDHDGNVYGGALSYGWFWRWTPRWGMEFSLGVGVAVFEYDQRLIRITDSGFALTATDRYRKTYIGPTNIGINLVFMI